ncbi:MAG: hypothetical protein RLZZ491_1838 [Pseudomonadota bacterium]
MPAARRRLGAIVMITVVAMVGMAAAQDRPSVVPQPRPTGLVAAQPAPADDAAPAPADTAPTAQSPDVAPEPASTALAAPQVPGPQLGPVTGFPIPRYVSLKAGEANARRGPSRSHRIDWVFQRRNMPVRVVAEHGHWRRIIDRDGAGGWVHYTLLSGVRTVIVEAELLAIRARPDPDATMRAQAERDVIAELHQCRSDWCEIEAGGYRGWVEATGLWGVDPGETIE